MPTKVKLLVAGAAFLAGGVLLVPRLLEPVSDRPLSESVETPSSVLTEPLELSASKPSPSTIGESREVVDADDSAAAATEPAAASHSVRGLVIGPDTHPVGDVDLRWTPEGDGAALPVTCDARGRFEFECEAQRGVIESADERYATILAGRFRVNGSEAVVVVGRRIALSGRVRDYAGQELAGARVSYELPKGFARRFPQVLDASLEQTFVATADEDGGFEFTRLPAVEGSQLITSQPGYSDDERAAPSFETHGLDVVLASRDASRRSVRGIVIDPSGSPVPGAWVSAGAWEDTTDDRGEFLFDAPIAAQAKEIVAVHAGYLPARAQGMPDGEVSLWPAFVTLQFKGTPLTLEGLVVNDVGNPVAGARVWLDDPTRFAIRPSGPVLVENVLSAARTTDEIMEAGEDVQATPNSIWSWVTTDDNGHFRIEGLVARDYRLAAMDMETLVTTRRAGVAAGSVGVKLVLPTQNGTRAIAGRVLTETGVPIVDAGVMIQCAPYRISGFTWTVLGPKTRSDADGRFMLPVCPSEGELYVYAPEFVSSKLDLTLIEEGRDVEVRLAGHGGDSHFRVVLDDPSFADRVVLYDEEEMPVHLTIVRGGARYGRQDAQIVDGESYTFLLREGTYEVVFYRAGVEVGRRWEVFVSGEVHTLGRR